MKTISAIYAHCLTSLNDDWLSSPEGSTDMDENAVSEAMLTTRVATDTDYQDEPDEGNQSTHAHSIV
jgi:hypothetical protein